MTSQQVKVFAIFVTIILVTASGIYWFQSNQNDPPPDDDNNDDDPPIIPPENDPIISVNFSIEKNLIFRGQEFKGSLEVTSDLNISVTSVSLELVDPYYRRTGSQKVIINQDIKTTLTIHFPISPAFPLDDAAVISRQNVNYEIFFVSLQYNTSQQTYSDIFSQMEIVNIEDSTAYNQAYQLVWNYTGNASLISQNATHVNLSGSANQTYSWETTFNATGYSQIQYNATVVNSTLNFILNNRLIQHIEGRVPIGNYNNLTNLIIAGVLNGSGFLNLNLSIITKQVTLFAVIADDNWAGQSLDAFNFRNPEFYLKKASSQFSSTLNLTIIPAAYVALPPANPPNLINFADSTHSVIGNALQLVNLTWTFGPGTYEENKGYDILLIFTNKTMSNLGIVLGTNLLGAFNMAIHARGSLNTGNYRLPPSFADNLIQHEVSHLFGAPDRFTSDSDKSIMTKSLPEDALLDILTGSFWLSQTTWLEQDIQTMIRDIMTTYWYYFS